MIILKSPEEIEYMREANQVVAETLTKLAEVIMPGITTLELDRISEEKIRGMGAEPAFLGYRGFPKSLCVSINNEVVHGIPKGRKIKEGDIVSLDLGSKKNGFYGDSALTVAVGNIPDRAKELIRVTEESLYKGIEKAVLGNRLHDISAAVQNHVEAHGFSVVRQFVGHGIGKEMHEEPQIPNFGKAGTGVRLKEGMTIAIEPMVNMGGWEVEVEEDGWTVVTLDGSMSAHFEHSIAITRDGPVILSDRKIR
jgi:methionyl aminopeptidase